MVPEEGVKAGGRMRKAWGACENANLCAISPNTLSTKRTAHERREETRGHALSFCENANLCAIFARKRER